MEVETLSVNKVQRLRMAWWARLLFTSGIVVAGGTALWAASFPGGHLIGALVALGLMVLLGLGWLSLGIVCLARRRLTWWLLAIPLTTIAAAALAYTDIPFRVGFTVAKPDLNAAADASTCPDRVGWYPVARCSTAAGERVVIIRDAGFLSSEGFARLNPDALPEPTPGEDAAVIAEPIEDGWYRVTFTF